MDNTLGYPEGGNLTQNFGWKQNKSMNIMKH